MQYESDAPKVCTIWMKCNLKCQLICFYVYRAFQYFDSLVPVPKILFLGYFPAGFSPGSRIFVQFCLSSSDLCSHIEAGLSNLIFLLQCPQVRAYRHIPVA